ncbi:hypothetical protein [Streptomyces sp. NPDC058622]|uniref:hypothetical protein n=1 Tax=Streptomyces sp. NPDC058622 TaxID=3346562 RepID=UPI0036526D94
MDPRLRGPAQRGPHLRRPAPGHHRFPRVHPLGQPRSGPAARPGGRRPDHRTGGERGAALPGGRFLLGLEGYDFYDTWEHDRDGTVLDSWRSYGHYVIGTGIRVVETDRRIPTGSRVVRLLPGGVIERGPALNDPTGPRPLVLDDGTILALDAGELRAVDRRLGGTVLAELLPIAPDRASGHICALSREGERVTAVIAEPLPGHPTPYAVHTWTLRLHPPRT